MNNSINKNLQSHFIIFVHHQEGYGLGSLHRLMNNWVYPF